MASGSEMISALPSSWTHGPKKASVNTQSEASGLRRRFLVLTAVSRVLMITRPASSIAAGDRGHLRPSIGPGGRQHRPVVRAEELPGLVWLQVGQALFSLRRRRNSYSCTIAEA